MDGRGQRSLYIGESGGQNECTTKSPPTSRRSTHGNRNNTKTVVNKKNPEATSSDTPRRRGRRKSTITITILKIELAPGLNLFYVPSSQQGRGLGKGVENQPPNGRDKTPNCQRKPPRGDRIADQFLRDTMVTLSRSSQRCSPTQMRPTTLRCATSSGIPTQEAHRRDYLQSSQTCWEISATTEPGVRHALKVLIFCSIMLRQRGHSLS